MNQQYISIDYIPFLDIRNTEHLSKGTGCKYLLCLYRENYDSKGPDGETLIAKSWYRKYPQRKQGEAVVMFS